MTDESGADVNPAAELEPIAVAAVAKPSSSDFEKSRESDGTDGSAVDDPTEAVVAPVAAAPGLHPTARRFQNPLYRVMTMAGASLVAVLGLTAALVSRTLSPPVPMVWTTIDLVVTVVLFVWYSLGMRCHLDFDEDQVVVSTKTRTSTIDRSDVESIDLDSGWWGAIQPSGRPVVLALADGRTVRAYGALPSDAVGQGIALADLQSELGDPNDAAAARMEKRIAEKFGSDD